MQKMIAKREVFKVVSEIDGKYYSAWLGITKGTNCFFTKEYKIDKPTISKKYRLMAFKTLSHAISFLNTILSRCHPSIKLIIFRAEASNVYNERRSNIPVMLDLLKNFSLKDCKIYLEDFWKYDRKINRNIDRYQSIPKGTITAERITLKERII